MTATPSAPRERLPDSVSKAMAEPWGQYESDQWTWRMVDGYIVVRQYDEGEESTRVVAKVLATRYRFEEEEPEVPT